MYNPSVSWCVQTCWLCALEVDQLHLFEQLIAAEGTFYKIGSDSIRWLCHLHQWTFQLEWLTLRKNNDTKIKNCSYLDFVRLFWSVSDYLLITLSWMFIIDPNLFIYILPWLRCSVQLFLIKSQIVHFRECQVFFLQGWGRDIGRWIGYRFFVDW